jgi:non-heme Fe2+,alpha-ketoglutarate-dependent halogenase
MPRHLGPLQVAQYRDKGYVSPLRAFSDDAARVYRGRLEKLERAWGGLEEDRKRKLHLYLAWVDEIAHHPRILDAVEDLIGPDILLFHLTLWLKEPRTDARISWHQDSTYFGLSPAEHVTAWVSLARSNPESGCVQVVPGSHHRGQIRHSVGQLKGNMLKIGQELDVSAGEPLELLVLEPGEFSLHHTHLFHNSMPNRSDDRRIGLGISYIPTRCRCSSTSRLSAMLVRGEDRHGHFDPEPRPDGDATPAALAAHAAAMQKWHVARAQIIAGVHAQAA